MAEEESAEVRRVQPTRRRKGIARATRASLANSAQLTCGVRVDLDGVMAARANWGEEFRKSTGVSLSPFAFIARATCLALGEMPLFNSTFDSETRERLEHTSINLGIAVDADDGLLVGNLKRADGQSVRELAMGINALANRMRTGDVQIDDVEGGTFTISNTGSRGSDFDTPILNWPEVAILAVPAIRRYPVWHEERSEAGAFLPQWSTILCLTYDHQVADGADAARFLNLIGRNLANMDLDREVGAS